MILTTLQAAERLGITKQGIHALIYSGVLKAKKFGRDYQISETAVKAARDRPRRGRPRKATA